MRASDQLLRDDVVTVLDGIRPDGILLDSDRMVLEWIEAGDFNGLFSKRPNPCQDLVAWLHVLGLHGLAKKARSGHYEPSETERQEFAATLSLPAQSAPQDTAETVGSSL